MSSITRKLNGVPPNRTTLFYNVRTAQEPPTNAGYGTQIATQGFGLNDVFRNLNIPLRFEMRPISSIPSPSTLVEIFQDIESANTDALVCFNHGYLNGKFEPFTGHCTVFDRLIENKVRLIDPSWMQPKWRLVEIDILHEAMRLHGDECSGGIWQIKQLQG